MPTRSSLDHSWTSGHWDGTTPTFNRGCRYLHSGWVKNLPLCFSNTSLQQDKDFMHLQAFQNNSLEGRRGMKVFLSAADIFHRLVTQIDLGFQLSITSTRTCLRSANSRQTSHGTLSARFTWNEPGKAPVDFWGTPATKQQEESVLEGSRG